MGWEIDPLLSDGGQDSPGSTRSVHSAPPNAGTGAPAALQLGAELGVGLSHGDNLRVTRVSNRAAHLFDCAPSLLDTLPGGVGGVSFISALVTQRVCRLPQHPRIAAPSRGKVGVPSRVRRRHAQFFGTDIGPSLSLVEFGFPLICELFALVGDVVTERRHDIALFGNLVPQIGGRCALVGVSVVLCIRFSHGFIHTLRSPKRPLTAS